MIEKPELSLVEYIRAGASAIALVHPEASVHLHRTLHLIRSEGARAGVALNPHTPPELIEYVLGDIDLILVMSVNRFRRSGLHSQRPREYPEPSTPAFAPAAAIKG